MDIKELDMLEVSKEMEVLITEHFTGYTILNNDRGIFSEFFLFAISEIDPLIIQQIEKPPFHGGKWFGGASGIIELAEVGGEANQNYIVTLVMDEPQTQALFLYVTKWSATTNDDINILIKDFTKDSEVYRKDLSLW